MTLEQLEERKAKLRISELARYHANKEKDKARKKAYDKEYRQKNKDKIRDYQRLAARRRRAKLKNTL